MLTLISATPSPYARKIRIALNEKGIPFTLQNEVPWDSTTETPKYNPLEKLPILLFDDGRAPIYESHFILDYVTQKYAEQTPLLLPESLDDTLKAKQVEVVADGVCDAMGLAFFEAGRGERKSEEWYARQMRKVYGGIKALAAFVEEGGGEYIVGKQLTIADLAAGSLLGMLDLVGDMVGAGGWKEEYPGLDKYWTRLEERESFKETKPYMFEIKDKVA